MASVGDIYQSKVSFQLTQGQVGLAVMYYEVISGGTNLTAENVADEIDTNLLSPLQALMPAPWNMDRIFTINGMDNDDFNDTNPSRTGSLGGFTPPLFLSMGIRGPFPGPGMHRARHNLPGGNTSSLQGDGVWVAAFKNSLLALAQVFGDQFENANGLIEPVTIAGSFVLGTPPAKRASAVGEWEVNQFATTMKSRQSYAWEAPT